ncbi:hypothetical protein D3C87_1028190 [compost metagenome]
MPVKTILFTVIPVPGVVCANAPVKAVTLASSPVIIPLSIVLVNAALAVPS